MTQATSIPPFRRPGIIATAVGFALYLLSLTYWSFAVGEGFEDILFVGLIMGAMFGLLAFVATRGMKPLGRPAAPFRHEGWWIAGYIAFLTLYLAFGPGHVSMQLAASTGLDIPANALKLVEKLIVFVALPWFVFFHRHSRLRLTFGLPTHIRDAVTPRAVVLFLLFATAFTGIQALFGQHWTSFVGAASSGGPAFWTGVLFTYVWLFVEAGLVEEFAFRAFLQDRVATLLGSPAAGLVIGVVVFALAHVPGLFLRTFDGGQSLLFTTAYALLVLAPAGLAFAVIWARTRNLLLLIAIHASVDLIPNYKELSGLIGL